MNPYKLRIRLGLHAKLQEFCDSHSSYHNRLELSEAIRKSVKMWRKADECKKPRIDDFKDAATRDNSTVIEVDENPRGLFMGLGCKDICGIVAWMLSITPMGRPLNLYLDQGPHELEAEDHGE